PTGEQPVLARGRRGWGRSWPGWRPRGEGGPGRVRQYLHRVRVASGNARPRVDQDRAHRPGLHRSDERPDGPGHGTRTAERLARAGAAAVPPAVPERHRRRTARPAPATVAGRSGDHGEEGPTVTRSLRAAIAPLIAGVAACHKVETAPPYTLVPVARRDIVVTATASGVIQPILTLSVKSKASGETLEMPVQTGDEVRKGTLLAKIDPRIPRNNLTQAQANLNVAEAQLENATAQLKRSDALYQSK